MPKSEKPIITTDVDPDDAPAWTPDVFERAEFSEGGKVVRRSTGTLARRGRPPLDRPKQQVTLRLDQDVLDLFRGQGPGWQGRINAALRKAVKI
ncbi:MAG: BrnA antitoxin family protein [Caulobacterales bacterium]|nr:BrnA antitoxin family protein [Caulobacterales bacterium]